MCLCVRVACVLVCMRLCVRAWARIRLLACVFFLLRQILCLCQFVCDFVRVCKCYLIGHFLLPHNTPLGHHRSH